MKQLLRFGSAEPWMVLLRLQYSTCSREKHLLCASHCRGREYQGNRLLTDTVTQDMELECIVSNLFRILNERREFTVLQRRELLRGKHNCFCTVWDVVVDWKDELTRLVRRVTEDIEAIRHGVFALQPST